MENENPFMTDDPSAMIQEIPATTEDLIPVEATAKSEGDAAVDTAAYAKVKDICRDVPMTAGGQSVLDAINIFAALAVLIFVARSPLKSMVARVRRHISLFLAILFAVLTLQFAYPSFFGVGQSGRIGFSATLEFIFAIAIAAQLAAFQFTSMLRESNFMHHAPTKFKGIGYLHLGTGTFSLCAAIFLGLTESNIAYWTFAIIHFAFAFMLFARMPFTDYAEIDGLRLRGIFWIAALIGILSGALPIVALAGVLLSYEYANTEHVRALRHKTRKILRNK